MLPLARAGRLPAAVLCWLAGLALTGCSGMKDIPDDAVLLHRVRVTTAERRADVDVAQMKQYVRQRERTRWFGLVRPPVVLDTLSMRRSAEDLRLALLSKGYLQAWCEAVSVERGAVSVERGARREVDLTYVLHPGEPYTVGTVATEWRDTLLRQRLAERGAWSVERGAWSVERGAWSLLRTGERFSVETLDAERKRVTALLTNDGYYRFNKDYISFRADTVAGRRTVDLTMVVHPFRVGETDTVHPRYVIGSVNYSSGDGDDEPIGLRPQVVRSNTFITPGEPYSSDGLQNTYNHFGRLGAVRYTSINFRERAGTDTLDCDIQLSTNRMHSISFQPEGTNTAGDLGAAVSVTYQNRNLFRGSELLSLELRGAYEAIKGLEGYSNQDYVEYSAEAKLVFPRFIAPLLGQGFRRRVNATSEVSLMYDLQNRPEFHRRVLSLAWRYKWANTGHHDRYQLDLLDLNYVFMPWISETFRHDYLDDTTTRNAILRYNYENLFIMKIGFSYAYNNGRYAIKTNVETAGNLLNVASKLLNARRDGEMGQYRLFNIAYAQYVKGDFDFTRVLSLSAAGSQSLVFHFGLGVAYPYGNSTILPFEKRYFSGGANSVRGWSVRSLGPGTYSRHDGLIDFINQTGDMKLDVNLELRSPLFWKLGGALFVDAGNIWTLRAYDDQPGGQFKVRNLLKELAVSYGVGFRFNFDYFILRFDLGMKAVNPAYESAGEEHYPLLHPKLSRDFAFHFAVGLPF